MVAEYQDLGVLDVVGARQQGQPAAQPHEDQVEQAEGHQELIMPEPGLPRRCPPQTSQGAGIPAQVRMPRFPAPTRSVAEPLDPCDEHEFVGLVYQECHQALAARPERETAQRPGRLSWIALVLRRIHDDNSVKQLGQRSPGMRWEARDLVFGQVLQLPPVQVRSRTGRGSPRG